MTEFFEEKRKTTGSCATARKPSLREMEWLSAIWGWLISPALLEFVVSWDLSTMQLTSAAKYPATNSTTVDHEKVS